jgi:FkbM family methyltransferase
LLKSAIKSLLRRAGLAVIRARTYDQLTSGAFVVYGHRMIGAPDDAGLSIFRASFAKSGPEIELFRSTIKPGMTVVDLGANVGLYTLQFASLVGDTGHVYAFEPGPLSYGLLKANLALNRYYRNVTVENAAVSDSTGNTELHICATGESDNRIAGFATDERERVPVRCFALDDYFKPGTQVDFIKMDIQGAEIKALHGMRRVIAENPSLKLFVEANTGLVEAAEVMHMRVTPVGASDVLLQR